MIRCRQKWGDNIMWKAFLMLLIEHVLIPRASQKQQESFFSQFWNTIIPEFVGIRLICFILEKNGTRRWTVDLFCVVNSKAWLEENQHPGEFSGAGDFVESFIDSGYFLGCSCVLLQLLLLRRLLRHPYFPLHLLHCLRSSLLQLNLPIVINQTPLMNSIHHLLKK